MVLKITTQFQIPISFIIIDLFSSLDNVVKNTDVKSLLYDESVHAEEIKYFDR